MRRVSANGPVTVSRSTGVRATVSKSVKRCLRAALAATGLGMALGAGAVEIEPHGRLHLDYATHDSGTVPLDDGFRLRRAELGLDGKLGDDWSFELQYDFADVYEVTDDRTARDGSFRDGFDDIALQYEGWSAGDITVGQFKVPFGLEELTSSNNISLIERSLPSDAIAPSRRVGAGFGRVRDRYTVSVMAHDSSIGGDEGPGVAARFTATPVRHDDTLLHLGVAVATERPDGEVKFNARSESRVADVKLVKTPDLGAVDRVDRIGLEAAWKSGPFSVQSEWMRAMVDRGNGNADVAFDGWYVMGSWVLTGESREYKGGRFKGIAGDRRSGAWELTARYSQLDLDAGDVRGGRQHNFALGLNYYAGRHLRIMANYIKVRSERRGVADNPDILLVRAQVAF